MIIAIAAAIAFAALVVFLSDANNRAWLSEQLAQGVTIVASLLPHIDQSRDQRKGGWTVRDTDTNGRTRVTKLSDAEIRRRVLHREKEKAGMVPKDSYYKDEDGNLYSGGERGELTETNE